MISTTPKAKATPKEPIRTEHPRTLYFWLAALGGNIWLSIPLLVVINFAIYHQSLSGYFLADDFVHVSYLNQVMNGKAYLLLENFKSTWMQTEGTQFYRPVISLTLALDYLFWGPRAFGFHLSNLFYQCLSTIGLYLLCRRLFITDLTLPIQETKRQEKNSAVAPLKLSPDHSYTLNIQALLAACIFAAHPLHPEVVSWIIGRVDSVCAAGYLFSFWLFLVSIQTSSSRRALVSRTLSLLLFAVALGSKEMAVTLPPSMVLLLLLFPTKGSTAARSLIISIVRAFKLTWHYWLLLGLYFLIRTFALGSFSGGYQGSIAEGFSTSLLTRLLSEQSLYRVMFPLNAEVFAGNQIWLNCLRTILGLSLFSFVVNLLISRSKPTLLRAVCFAGAWFAIVMLPTIPVWNLTGTLQSSRFIYLGTAPLAILLALAICPLARRGRRSTTSQSKTEFTLRISQDCLKGLTAVLSVSLVVLLSSITLKNNAPWVHAGKELIALQKELTGALSSIPESKKLALLNLPDRYMGSHMLYNGTMLQVLMEPPLTKSDLSKRIVTFEPALYGDSDLLVTSRLRAIVAAPDRFVVYRWRRDIFALEKLSLKRSARETSALATFSGSMKMSPATLLVSPPLNLDVLDCDLLEAEFSISKEGRKKNMQPATGPRSILVRFNSPDNPVFDNSRSLIMKIDNEKNLAILHTSEHKSWVGCQKINRIALTSSDPNSNLHLDKISCKSGADSTPTLSIVESESSTDLRGIINIPPGKKSIEIDYDASLIPGAKEVVYQISRPNSFFEHYTGTFRDRNLKDDALVTGHLSDLMQQNLPISLSRIDESGFYQIRLAACDGDKILGYFSDPLLLQINR